MYIEDDLQAPLNSTDLGFYCIVSTPEELLIKKCYLFL